MYTLKYKIHFLSHDVYILYSFLVPNYPKKKCTFSTKHLYILHRNIHYAYSYLVRELGLNFNILECVLYSLRSDY